MKLLAVFGLVLPCLRPAAARTPPGPERRVRRLARRSCVQRPLGDRRRPRRCSAWTGAARSAQAAAAAGAGLAVNAYLWRATLDTLSFMPLAWADPFGGTIITDWYSPPGATGERFRAQAYVMGRQLRSDGVRVQVFRQAGPRRSGWTARSPPRPMPRWRTRCWPARASCGASPPRARGGRRRESQSANGGGGGGGGKKR